MMSLEKILPAEGSNKVAGKRLGRGQSSGKGGTLPHEVIKELNHVLDIQKR